MWLKMVSQTQCDVDLLSQNISKSFPCKSSEDGHSTILACAQDGQNGHSHMYFQQLSDVPMHMDSPWLWLGEQIWSKSANQETLSNKVK